MKLIFPYLVALLAAPAASVPCLALTFCNECLPASVYDAPGIGFDLTYGYGTAVAHFVNGSVVDIGRVEGYREYVALLSRLVNAPAPAPLTWLEKWRRWMNKQLGSPATPDVGVLGEMLVSLRDQTISLLSPALLSPFQLDHVVVTYPELSGLREQDLNDAFELAGFRSWLDQPSEIDTLRYPGVIRKPHAAFAANGIGLCRTYRNVFMCRAQEEVMLSHNILAASFTRHALYLAAGPITSPFCHFCPGPFVSTTDLNAGLDSIDAYTSQDEFWDRIRNHLRDVAQQAFQSSSNGLTDILLMGENVTHRDFLDALRDGLADVRTFKGSENVLVGETIFPDPTFAAARGAAHYARWRQEAPFGCAELAKCDEERRRDRGNQACDENPFSQVIFRLFAFLRNWLFPLSWR